MPEGYTPTCKVCLSFKPLCFCPECPQCGERGLPKCYQEHPLKLNREQLIARTSKRIEDLEEEAHVEKNFLGHLHSQEESYCEDWSEI